MIKKLLSKNTEPAIKLDEVEFLTILKSNVDLLIDHIEKIHEDVASIETGFEKVVTKLSNLVNQDEFGGIDFKESIVKNNVINFPEVGTKLIYTPKKHSDIIQVFADIYIQSKLDPRFQRKYEALSKIHHDPMVAEQLAIVSAKEVLDFGDYVFLTYIQYDYNVSGSNQEVKLIIKDILLNKYDDLDFELDYEKITKIIDKQLKMIPYTKVRVNPVFGSARSGVSAQGDVIFDSTLVEIKCSIRPEIKMEYIYELVGMTLLNELLDKPHQINSYAYWNPLYGTFVRFQLPITSSVKQAFHTLRHNYCSAKINGTSIPQKAEFKTLINKLFDIYDKMENGTITFERALKEYDKLNVNEMVSRIVNHQSTNQKKRGK